MAETVAEIAPVAPEETKTVTETEATPATTNGSTEEAKPAVVEAEKPDETTNGAAPTTEGTAEPSAQTSPQDSKKRKASPAADDRDWRTRREEDNRRDGDRDRRDGRGRGRGGPRGGRGRGGDRPFQNYRDNIKTRYEDLPESSDPDDIRKQVEFYFSDSNLPADKFLLSQVGGSANHPVSIKTIHSFKRMRRFQPYSAVVDALRESETLTLTDKEEIQRKIPLVDGLTDDPVANVELVEDRARPRSIYAKGFGAEGPSTQFDIEAFFAPYGPINAIRLRRQEPEKTFKGSVFVEFDSEETQKAFLGLENKPKWEGKALKISSKEEYVMTKAKDIKEGRIRGSASRGRGRGRGGDRGDRGGRGRGRGRGDRRDGDDRRDRRDRRDRNDDDRDDGKEGSEQKSADTAAEVADTAAKVDSVAAAEATSEANPTKKRAREDEVDAPAADEGAAKKAKVDEATAEA